MPLGFYVFFPETSCRLIEMYINDVSFITRLKNVKPMLADTAVCGMPIYIIHKIKYFFFSSKHDQYIGHYCCRIWCKATEFR